MKLSLALAVLLLAASCGETLPVDPEKNGDEQPGTPPDEEDKVNPLMMIDYIKLGKRSIEIGDHFPGAEFKLFSSRDWTVDYDRDLIKIEPESGPGQLDSQLVRVTLREGAPWDAYVRDAVFTAGKWKDKLLFRTYIPPYPLPKPGDALKIIEFNIERGMAKDKANNFDNFVAWVKEMDPDILCLCECNEFNDDNLQRLANRWGHPYVACTVDDGWNPAITSKYPMTDIVKYTKGFSHGAVSAKILGINVLCMHACASWYSDGDWYGGEAKNYDGIGGIDAFDYRIAELHALFDQTIFAHPEEKYYILTGDLNAVSRTDERWWSNGNRYWVEHDYILSLNYWTDIVRQQNPDKPMFTYSRSGVWDEERMKQTEVNPRQMAFERLDYFYLSKDLVPWVEESHTLYNDFTNSSSDHRPVYMKVIYQKQ